MKQKTNRVLSLVVAISLVWSTLLGGVSVRAIEGRSDDRIFRSSASLIKNSDGDFSISIFVRATTTMGLLGAESVKVMRKGVFGPIVEYSFDASTEPSLLIENSYLNQLILHYKPIFKEKEYYVEATIYAEDESGVSTLIETSNTVTS